MGDRAFPVRSGRGGVPRDAYVIRSVIVHHRTARAKSVQSVASTSTAAAAATAQMLRHALNSAECTASRCCGSTLAVKMDAPASPPAGGDGGDDDATGRDAAAGGGKSNLRFGRNETNGRTEAKARKKNTRGTRSVS